VTISRRHRPCLPGYHPEGLCHLFRKDDSKAAEAINAAVGEQEQN